MSDYIERLMGRARNGDFWENLPETNTPAPEPTETRAVRRDMFDKSSWSQITDQVHALGEQVARAEEKHPTAGGAYEDLFNLLNQGDPRFHDVSAMEATYVPQHLMEQQMFAADDFQWVRNETKYDEYTTALAMLSMERQMDSALDDVEEAQEAIEAAMDALDEAMEAAQQFVDGQGGTPVAGEGGDTEQEVIDRLENALKGMADAKDQGEGAAEEAAAQMRNGATKAKEAIEEERENASAYGIEPSQLKRMDFAERQRLTKRINRNRLAKFAKMIGALRMSADADRRRKVTGAPADIYSVELGNDLTRVTASEINDLANPDTEDLFWLRFAKAEMLQWKVRGPERAGQGPIIVVCDESGSMGAPLDNDGNTREAWSKAVSLALVDQAKRGGRDFIYIGFASRGEVWETRFVKGTYDHNQIIDFAEHFFSGGTSYEGPLTRAMEIIGEYERSRKAKPDVVFITDAECQVGEAFVAKFREVRERADVRCYGIQIGGSGHYTAMEQLVDRLININALNANYDAVAELFRTI